MENKTKIKGLLATTDCTQNYGQRVFLHTKFKSSYEASDVEFAGTGGS